MTSFFKFITVFAAALFLCSCIDRKAVDDFSDMKTELSLILNRIGFAPFEVWRPLVKQEAVLVGATYKGRENFNKIQTKLDSILVEIGYSTRDGELHFNGAEGSLFFCHKTIPGRYVTWTVRSPDIAALQIHSEGFRKNYPYCSALAK